MSVVDRGADEQSEKGGRVGRGSERGWKIESRTQGLIPGVGLLVEFI